MFDVMSQAKNAMEAYSTKLKAIGANITNMSVPGYKRTDMSFQDIFSKMISGGSPSSFTENTGGSNPTQLGGTTAISGSFVDFTKGSFIEGSTRDLALTEGNKLFITSNDNGASYLYTRSGETTIDPISKKMLTKSGNVFYGFRRSGGITSSGIEPIDLTGLSYDETTITWDNNGVLRQSGQDAEGNWGAELPWCIAVTTFNNLSGLEYRDGTCFSETISSGPPAAPSAPGINTVTGGQRENSNVAYTSEVVDSMEIQRALDASLTVIRMANDTITGFINKLS